MSYDAFKNITIQQLESLVALLEAGSFTKAAAKLFISQSALTKQIKSMEASAGTTLVSRGSTGITLTAEGQILYDYAKRITRLLEDAKERVERLKNQESGHIYVSASTTPSTYILPHLLTQVQQKHPDIKLHIQMHDSDETTQCILNNQAEIGIIGKEVLNKKIISEPLCKDELVLAVPVHHPLAGQESITLKELAGTAFIAREHGSGTLDIVEKALQRHAGKSPPQFNVIAEMGSAEAVKEAILAGLGVSILSLFAVRRELSQGLITTVNIIDCPMERYFYIIYRKNFPFRKHHQHFLEVARSYQPL
jgi:LysR family transcriptional regulator, transcriptional activator of the cysJI operon